MILRPQPLTSEAFRPSGGFLAIGCVEQGEICVKAHFAEAARPVVSLP